jgi:predicted nucleic acid-binding protein
MILYLDTSAVVKLFIHEAGTDYVQGLFAPVGIFGTSRICQPEFSAALSKSVRMGFCTNETAEGALKEFTRVWGSVIKVDADAGVLGSAADLAWENGLRGYDAVHLASAMRLESLARSHVTMVTYDKQLWDVSRKVGMVTLPERL